MKSLIAFDVAEGKVYRLQTKKQMREADAAKRRAERSVSPSKTSLLIAARKQRGIEREERRKVMSVREQAEARARLVARGLLWAKK